MHTLLPLLSLSLALLSPPALALTVPGSLDLTNPTPPTTTPPTTSGAPPLNGTTSSDLNGTASNANAFTCLKRTAQTTQEPDFADCAAALRSLPLNAAVGVFWNAGEPLGDFQLPYFETYRSCQVVVSLRSAYDRVRSSWLAVAVAALELNAACQGVRAAPGLGSAVTFVDGLQTMKIELKGVR